MEAVAPHPTQKKPTTPAVQMGQVYLEGRIAFRRRMRGQEGPYFLSVLKIPAQDQFSHPGTVEVLSHDSLGQPGDDWKGICEVTGYPRSYDSKPDKESGEVTRIHTAEVRLRVLEQ